jgi:sec-independent protein translocase protein TatC
MIAASERMPFQKHLLELRRRLVMALASVLLFSAAGYIVFPYFYDFIQSILSEELFATKIHEAFLTRVRIALLLGLFLSLPVIFYQVIAYILPAFDKKGKVFALVLLFSSFVLFCGGILFSLEYVMPITVRFLRARRFFPSGLSRIISYENFILFFFQFILAFGICLQFPVVLLLLLKFKIIKYERLVKSIKIFIPAALLLSGILTPPDLVSQIMLTAPLVFLYVLCIVIAKILKWG